MRAPILILFSSLLAAGHASAKPQVDCEAFTRAKQGHTEFLLQRGICHLNNGAPDLAISDFDQFITEHPDWVAGYFNRGNAHFARNDYALAIDDYNRALELPAKDPAGIIWNRGNAHAELMDYAGAIADYDEAISLRPNVAELHRIRADVYGKAGDREQAKEGYRKALSLDPQNMAAQSGLRDLTDAAPAIPSEPPKSLTFPAPRYGGYRVDWCRYWGVGCGKPAADEFCRRRGFAEAASFARAPHIGANDPTVVIGSGQLCARSKCSGFANVTCEK